MKKTITILVSLCIILMITPFSNAINVGTGIVPDIETEDFKPLVWLCDNRIVLDDNVEPGRKYHAGGGQYFHNPQLVERVNNYAFEGEQIQWNVLVMDKNGIQKISDVYMTVGNQPGDGNPIEANCVESQMIIDEEFYQDDFKVQAIYVPQNNINPACNARILEEQLTDFNPDIMRYYTCTFTVETPYSMYGEYYVTVEAMDLDGEVGTIDEHEYWFLNPEMALSIDGDFKLDSVRQGTNAYSETFTVGNEADEGSGVIMDMFISGTDFYDSSSSGAACPDTNQLRLGNGDSNCDSTDAFCYFATTGAYSTHIDARSDTEGYVGINYGIGFNDPNPFYGKFDGDSTGNEIIQGLQLGPYFPANILGPGAEHSITFRVNLPEPCNGDFDTGSIFFWGEAI